VTLFVFVDISGRFVIKLGLIAQNVKFAVEIKVKTVLKNGNVCTKRKLSVCSLL
jgi:hypothetical protein